MREGCETVRGGGRSGREERSALSWLHTRTTSAYTFTYTNRSIFCETKRFGTLSLHEKRRGKKERRRGGEVVRVVGEAGVVGVEEVLGEVEVVGAVGRVGVVLGIVGVGGIVE